MTQYIAAGSDFRPKQHRFCHNQRGEAVHQLARYVVEWWPEVRQQPIGQRMAYLLLRMPWDDPLIVRYVRSYPRRKRWLTGVLKHLLSLLEHLRATRVESEVILPQFISQFGKEKLDNLRPDILVWSELLAGWVLVEIKTGKYPVQMMDDKANKYLLGAAFKTLHPAYPGPVREVIWVSYAEYGPDGKRRSIRPHIRCERRSFNAAGLSRWTQERYRHSLTDRLKLYSRRSGLPGEHICWR